MFHLSMQPLSSRSGLFYNSVKYLTHCVGARRALLTVCCMRGEARGANESVSGGNHLFLGCL